MKNRKKDTAEILSVWKFGNHEHFAVAKHLGHEDCKDEGTKI